MADYNIRLGVEVDTSGIQSQINSAANGLKPIELNIELGDIKGELKSLNTELKNIGKSIGTLDSGGGMKNLLSSINQISSALDGVTAQFNSLSSNNGIKGVAQAAQQAARQTDRIISDSAEKAIKGVSSKRINRYFEVSSSDSNAFKKEMDNLVKQWTNGKGNIVDLKIETRTSWDKDAEQNIERLHQAHVTYQNALGETIKKTIAWRKIGTNTVLNADGKEMTQDVRGFVEVASQYSKSVDKTKTKTDNFAKQQKQAAANLTNQINQMNRAAVDENASRPIKQASNLEALKNKYNDITSAIQRMSIASRDTFDDEQINVKRLISEYKSMTSEFRNSENVAAKMKGVDFKSGLEIAKNDLNKFKADAKDFSQIAGTISNLDTEIGRVGDASSLNKFNDQLRVARSELAKIKSETAASNRGEKVGINTSGLKSQISDLQKLSPEINQFEAEINGAKVSVQSLLNDLGRVKTQGDFSVVNSRFKAFSDAAKAAGIAVKETVVKTQSVTNIQNKLKDTGFDGFFQEVYRANAEVRKIDASADDLSAALTRVNNAFDAVKTADETGDMKALVAANEEYEESLKRLYSVVNLYKQAQQDAFDKDNLDLDKQAALLKLEGLFESGSQAARVYGDEVQKLGEKINNCADPKEMKNLKKQIDIIDKGIDNKNLQRETPWTKIKNQFDKYKNYFSVASVVMYATQGLRDMFQQVLAVDTAMTELKKVTNETDASYDKFLSNAAQRSKEIGTTIDGLVSSTADFARLGYSFEESAGLAEVANIYTVVGDEIDSVDTATQSLVSTLAAFKHEMGDMSDSDFAMSIVDKFNEVSNNFAISSGGIGEALQRSASSMAAANNTLDETIALTTAANEVVQNPEKVGNALKTISMRIRGAKTELEEAGESTDGMAESTASLRAEMLALSDVDIMEND